MKPCVLLGAMTLAGRAVASAAMNKPRIRDNIPKPLIRQKHKKVRLKMLAKICNYKGLHPHFRVPCKLQANLIYLEEKL